MIKIPIPAHPLKVLSRLVTVAVNMLYAGKLLRAHSVGQVFCAPGNGGTAGRDTKQKIINIDSQRFC